MKLGAMIHSTTDFGNDRRPLHDGVRMITDAVYDFITLLSAPGRLPLKDPSDQISHALIDVVNSDPKALCQVVSDHGLEMVHLHAGAYMVDDKQMTQRSMT